MKYIFGLFLLFFSQMATSKPIELSRVTGELFINGHLNVLHDASAEISLLQALQLYQQGRFIENTAEKVSFNFTQDAIWASVHIDNDAEHDLERIFYLDSAWLDHAEFYFIYEGDVVEHAIIGDTFAFSTRDLPMRMLAHQHRFKPGKTHVLMRFKSKDPLLIPIYLSTEKIIQNYLIKSSYFYGFLYGAFFILLIYNIALTISLKDIRYVFYSFYLLSFLSLNVAYTGHGFKYIWSNSTFIQEWAMIVFLYFYIIFGVAFCFEFLKLKIYLAKVYRARIWIYSALITLVASLLIYADQLLAVKIAVALTSLLVFIFLSLGALAFKNGHEMAKFFIPAVLMGAGGAAFSAATTWGAIPYNTILFHGIEVGMLIEMFVLALALAFNLKEVDNARLIAEVNAQVDYLTALYNRRAFTAAVTPLWHLGIRDQKTSSMILIDIDWFKKINDKYGHAAGDAVIKSIANVLKLNIRKSDILARWGGEEFIIFLPNTNKFSAISLANIIRQKVAQLIISHDGNGLSVTASFGVAECTPQMKKLEDLVKLTDVALYKAKNSGRNTVCESTATS